MARKQSAGIVLYRYRDSRVEIILVHPGGPFWNNKDSGAWSIPKGEFEPGEDPLKAARREFHEETGFAVDGSFVLLTPVRQAGGKVVHAWAVKGDCEAESIKSNSFILEWPPRSGQRKTFSEVDRAEWFTFDKAREMLVKAQAGFIDQLEEIFEDAEQ